MRNWPQVLGLIGAPGEIRTPGLLVRSQALYPTELRAQRRSNAALRQPQHRMAHMFGSTLGPSGARILPYQPQITIPLQNAALARTWVENNFQYSIKSIC